MADSDVTRFTCSAQVSIEGGITGPSVLATSALTKGVVEVHNPWNDAGLDCVRPRWPSAMQRPRWARAYQQDGQVIVISVGMTNVPAGVSVLPLFESFINCAACGLEAVMVQVLPLRLTFTWVLSL